MMELWPFTNFHDLNLDWIIKTIKEWVKTMTETKKEIDEFMDSGFKDDVEEILAAHPEWTTTVMDGAITSQKINPDFLRSIENWFTTPEEFGAAGDGVTDDTTAVTEAIQSGKPVRGYTGHTYLITDTIDTVDDIIIVNMSFSIPSKTAQTPILSVAQGKHVILYNCEFTSTNERPIDPALGNGYVNGYTSNIIGVYASYGAGEVFIEKCKFNEMLVDIWIQGTNVENTQSVSIRDCRSNNSLISADINYCNANNIANCIINQNSNADNLSHCIYIGYNDNNITGEKTITTISNSIFKAYSRGVIHCYHGSNYITNITNCDIESTAGRDFMSYGNNDVMTISNCVIKTVGPIADIGQNAKYEFVGCDVESSGYLQNQSNNVGTLALKACNIKCKQIASNGHISIDGSYIAITVTTAETVTNGEYLILNGNRIYYASTSDNPWRLNGNCVMVHNYCRNSAVTQMAGYATGSNNVVSGNVFDNCKATFYGYSGNFSTENILINIP